MANDAFQFDDAGEPTPKQKKGIGCFGGFLIGCGILFLILLIAGGIGGYFLYSFVKGGYTDDPVKINQWLQEVVECEVPAGYEGKMGLNYSLGEFRMKLLMFLPVAASLESEDPTFTRFIVFEGPPGADQSELEHQFEQGFENQMRNNPQIKGQKGERTESERVDIQVGEHMHKATRSIYTEGDKRLLSYMLSVKDGVLVVAFGPEEGFDMESFNAFLRSMKVPAPPEEAPSLEPEEAAPQEDPNAPPTKAADKTEPNAPPEPPQDKQEEAKPEEKPAEPKTDKAKPEAKPDDAKAEEAKPEAATEEEKAEEEKPEAAKLEEASAKLTFVAAA